MSVANYLDAGRSMQDAIAARGSAWSKGLGGIGGTIGGFSKLLEERRAAEQQQGFLDEQRRASEQAAADLQTRNWERETTQEAGLHARDLMEREYTNEGVFKGLGVEAPSYAKYMQPAAAGSVARALYDKAMEDKDSAAYQGLLQPTPFLPLGVPGLKGGMIPPSARSVQMRAAAAPTPVRPEVIKGAQELVMGPAQEDRMNRALGIREDQFADREARLAAAQAENAGLREREEAGRNQRGGMMQETARAAIEARSKLADVERQFKSQQMTREQAYDATSKIATNAAAALRSAEQAMSSARYPTTEERTAAMTTVEQARAAFEAAQTAMDAYKGQAQPGGAVRGSSSDRPTWDTFE